MELPLVSAVHLVDSNDWNLIGKGVVEEKKNLIKVVVTLAPGRVAHKPRQIDKRPVLSAKESDVIPDGGTRGNHLEIMRDMLKHIEDNYQPELEAAAKEAKVVAIKAFMQAHFSGQTRHSQLLADAERTRRHVAASREALLEATRELQHAEERAGAAAQALNAPSSFKPPRRSRSAARRLRQGRPQPELQRLPVLMSETEQQDQQAFQGLRKERSDWRADAWLNEA